MGSAEILLVGGLMAGAFAVYQFLSAILTNNNDKQILSWAAGDEPVKSKSPLINFSRPLVHNFTLQHAAKIKSQAYRKRVERLLLTGGLARELNVDEYIGLQILWGVMFPVLLIVLNFALQLELPIYLILGLGGVGFMGPQLYAKGQKGKRESSVQRDLPFFIDLLALSTEAGLDFVGAVQRIVDKAQDSVLAEELGNVLQDIKLGSSRTDAFRAMGSRLEVNEISSFISVLVDADSTGASIAQVLKDQSIQMRLERMVRAEKAGAKASQLILLPMMIFILPAVFIMLFGPVILQFMYGNQ